MVVARYRHARAALSQRGLGCATSLGRALLLAGRPGTFFDWARGAPDEWRAAPGAAVVGLRVAGDADPEAEAGGGGAAAAAAAGGGEVPRRSPVGEGRGGPGGGGALRTAATSARRVRDRKAFSRRSQQKSGRKRGRGRRRLAFVSPAAARRGAPDRCWSTAGVLLQRSRTAVAA